MWVLVPTDEILSFASPSHMDVVNVENAGAFFHKRKYPKKRRPGCRLFPALLAFTRGCQKGLPCPFDNVRHPCRTPNGLFPINAPMLGAAYGNGGFLNVGCAERSEAHLSRTMRLLLSAHPMVLWFCPHSLYAMPC
jgi:hypothetical protein